MNSRESCTPEELLRRIEQAGKKGRSLGQLYRGSTRAGVEWGVSALIERREIANIGTWSKPRFVSAKLFNALELARFSVQTKATPGMATLFSKSELGTGCAGDGAKKLDEAIAALIEEKKLLRLQRGKSVFFLHAASIEPLLHAPKQTRRRARPAKQPKPAAASRASAAPEPQFPAETVRAAYRELARESGFSDVLISDLQQRSAAPADALKPWLLQESRAGRVLPTRGDWSIADAAARTAAIEIGGEPHLRVRFV